MFKLFPRKIDRKGDVDGPRDIALLRLDNIGDAILTFGFIDALRRTWPNARLSVFCAPSVCPVFKLSPAVNAVFPLQPFLPREREAVLAKRSIDDFRSQFAGTFDLLINPRHGPDNYGAALYVAASEAPTRAGVQQTQFIDGWDPNNAYTVLAAPALQSEHAAEVPKRILAGLNLRQELSPISITPTRRAREKAQAFLKGRKAIVFALGAAMPYKIWAPENFATVATSLSSAGYEVVLIGAQSERPLAERFLRHFSGEVLDFVGQTDLDEAAAVIAACKLFIGNDSGPKHLSAAVGTPVVEVGWLGETTPGFPYDHGFAAVGVFATRLRPSGFNAHQTTGGAAVSSIRPSDVMQAAADLLQR